ncbi:MAG TPA: thiolase family protein [Myxococcota bacterium]|nr:thiolase family protein [Myxococcota bacterium]
MMLENVAILDAVRTPIGKGMKGVFNRTRPEELGAIALAELIKRTGIKYETIDDVIFGCAMPEAEQGMNVSRIISLRAGLPVNISAATVNRFCSSGLHAVSDIAKSIEVGQIGAGIGGGVESMSLVPMGGHKPSANPYLMEHMPNAYMSMGITAEVVAERFNIDRARQDQFSLLSHQKACTAIKKGLFDSEIVAVKLPPDMPESNDTVMVRVDEGPRSDTTLSALSALKPVFKANGTVTAGNSSQVSDGAAAVMLMHKAQAQKAKSKIRGYFRAFVTAGVDPDIMGTGPVPAVRKLLSLTGLSLDSIGVFELNEAFAAQAVYCIEELKLDPALVNPMGGAIALGHPLGCTGARQVATILAHMEREKIRYGICTMCIGGGMGAAGLIELA